ncbi:D-alanyl-D-alanine carboxypeptidase family protein [Phaeacidiphilus oryzae]|uniref:D-alanyl-D-alanine carboxypeptidase n=1 Tax=Phaeacidiphilus oryzae TaxID=348818 RepID=UPI0005651746|nr:D-alanyl-D-alanine carboxypeptidase [Phaeacidiphilus oryzae]
MTPLRQLARRLKIWGSLVVLLLVVFTVVQFVRPLPDPALKLTAASSYAFGGTAPAMPWPSAGQAAVEVEGLGSLGRSGPKGTEVPIASVTKVMTAYLILRDHPLKPGEKGPTLSVDAQAASDYSTGSAEGESVVKVTNRQKISEYQALQMLLIPSANNIARLLGRWDAGSDPAFVQKMQATAKQLGMDDTTYTDPSGLTPTTKSTADDQLKLARMVWQNAVFREIVGTGSFTPPGDGVMYNNNAVLYQDGIVGMKTGSSSAALGCLMFAAEYKIGGQTRTVLGVTLGQPATSSASILTNALNASKDLVVATEKSLESHDLVKKGEVVGYVDDGMGGHTPLVATKDSTVTGWGGLSVQLGMTPSAADGKVPHTAKAGDQVGYLTIGSGTGETKIPVALQSDLKQPSLGARWAHI